MDSLTGALKGILLSGTNCECPVTYIASAAHVRRLGDDWWVPIELQSGTTHQVLIPPSKRDAEDWVILTDSENEPPFGGAIVFTLPEWYGRIDQEITMREQRAQPPVGIDEALARVWARDLSALLGDLREEDPALTEADLALAEREYRRFWELKVRYPRQRLVVWHVLMDCLVHADQNDSKPLREFALAVLGGYLDHNPRFRPGVAGYDEAVEETHELYRKHWPAEEAA